jgi:hypothetical protein
LARSKAEERGDGARALPLQRPLGRRRLRVRV